MKVVLLLAFILAVSHADYCGGNCPDGNCPGCPCGEQMNYVDVVKWCSSYAAWNQVQCQCIVNTESRRGNSFITTWDGTAYMVGLWHIYQTNFGWCNAGNFACDLNESLQCAIGLWSQAGGSFKWWSSYASCGGV